MSFNNVRQEDQFGRLTIAPKLSDYIDSGDYVKALTVVISDSPENLTNNVKKIFNKAHSKEKITEIVSSIINLLNCDVSLWKFNNIINFFNEFEDGSKALFSQNGDPLLGLIPYRAMLESQFKMVFDSHKFNFDNLLDNKGPCDNLDKTHEILINFAKLVDINSADSVLYPLAQLSEYLLVKSLHIEVQSSNYILKLQSLAIEIIMHINHRLVNYLGVMPGNPVSKGLRETISIYEIIRKSIIDMNFVQPEVISNALIILEHRSRFFGLHADAMPENENHGDYIVIDPLNTPFEDDDVYDDYDRFLASLPE